jgi:hypothetical protein
MTFRIFFLAGILFMAGRAVAQTSFRKSTDILLFTEEDGITWVGQTGFSPGFVSMNYYYPATKTSVIMLGNTVYNEDDLSEAFYYHVQMLKEVKKYLLEQRAKK